MHCTVNGVPPVYQPAYVPGFAPYNVMGGAGGGYAQQSELSVQVESELKIIFQYY